MPARILCWPGMAECRECRDAQERPLRGFGTRAVPTRLPVAGDSHAAASLRNPASLAAPGQAIHGLPDRRFAARPCARPLRGAFPKPFGAQARHRGWKRQLQPSSLSWVLDEAVYPLGSRRVSRVSDVGPEGASEGSRAFASATGCRVCEPPEDCGERGNPRSGRRPGGRISFRPFSLAAQRKWTQGAGGGAPASSRKMRVRYAHSLIGDRGI
jgi:hypothetical protein